MAVALSLYDADGSVAVLYIFCTILAIVDVSLPIPAKLAFFCGVLGYASPVVLHPFSKNTLFIHESV
jgi:hypothetical protein